MLLLLIAKNQWGLRKSLFMREQTFASPIKLESESSNLPRMSSLGEKEQHRKGGRTNPKWLP